MPKESGLGWTTHNVDDGGGTARDIRNDITSFEFATPREVQVTTGIDKSAMERLLLLADASMTMNGVFNDAALTGAHTVLRTVPSTSINRTIATAISGQTLTMEMIITDYALTRADSGALTWTAPAALSDGTVPTWGP